MAEAYRQKVLSCVDLDPLTNPAPAPVFSGSGVALVSVEVIPHQVLFKMREHGGRKPRF